MQLRLCYLKICLVISMPPSTLHSFLKFGSFPKIILDHHADDANSTHHIFALLTTASPHDDISHADDANSTHHIFALYASSC